MRQPATTLLLLLFLCTLAPFAQAEYYKCKDAKGNITLQQQPCAGPGVTQTVLQDRPVNTYKDSTLSAANQAKVAALTGGTAAAEEEPGLFTATSIPPEFRNYAQQVKRKMAGLRTEKPVLFIAIVASWAAMAFFNLLLLLTAFRTSLWWGLGYLFVPLVAFVFLFMHWDRAGKPFVASLIFTGITVGLYLVA